MERRSPLARARAGAAPRDVGAHRREEELLGRGAPARAVRPATGARPPSSLPLPLRARPASPDAPRRHTRSPLRPPPFRARARAQEWNGLREITEKTFLFEGYQIATLLFTGASFCLYWQLVKAELEHTAHPRGTCVKGVRKLVDERKYAPRASTDAPLVQAVAHGKDRPAGMARPAL